MQSRQRLRRTWKVWKGSHGSPGGSVVMKGSKGTGKGPANGPRRPLPRWFRMSQTVRAFFFFSNRSFFFFLLVESRGEISCSLSIVLRFFSAPHMIGSCDLAFCPYLLNKVISDSHCNRLIAHTAHGDNESPHLPPVSKKERKCGKKTLHRTVTSVRVSWQVKGNIFFDDPHRHVRISCLAKVQPFPLEIVPERGKIVKIVTKKSCFPR